MFSLSHFFDRFVPRLQECRRRGRCENKLHLWIYILVFLFSVSYTTLIMSWQSSNSEVNRAKNSCNAEQPPSSKIYNVYKIVYKEKQDTLVTITKLKVSPGTCLATYGDSCSICSSKLFRVIKGASWRRLFFLKAKESRYGIQQSLICIFGKRVLLYLLACTHIDMTQVSMAI